jgi:hypothetical protein
MEPNYHYVKTLSAEPIEGDEAHIDFTVLIGAAFPYPQANLDQIEVYARMGWLSGETVQATYQGVVESLDEGRSLRLGYRLNKPPYGWPTQKIQIDIVGELSKIGGDGFSNFLRVAPGKSTVEVIIPPSDIIPPGETAPHLGTLSLSCRVRSLSRSMLIM